jgi:hypothetical protein
MTQVKEVWSGMKSMGQSGMVFRYIISQFAVASFASPGGLHPSQLCSADSLACSPLNTDSRRPRSLPALSAFRYVLALNPKRVKAHKGLTKHRGLVHRFHN